jgi:tetratricopeptide (TPR) repeat protein
MDVDVETALAVLERAREVEHHGADADAADWQKGLAPEAVAEAIPALVAADRIEAALDLAGCLSGYWQDLGRISQGIALSRSALDGAGAMRSRASARAHLVLGELAFRAGDQATAARHSGLAREIADEVGDAWVGARAELNLARVAFRDGDAPRIFGHARAVLERAGDHGRLQAGGRHMLGWAHYTAGDLPAALDAFEANAEAYRALGHPINEASERANVGDLAMEGGDLARARTQLDAAFAIPAVRRSRYLLPSLLRSVAALCALHGDQEGAVRLFAGAAELYRRYGFEPDPGDDFTPTLHAAASAAVDAPRRATITAAATSMSDEQLFEVARASLADTSGDPRDPPGR